MLMLKKYFTNYTVTSPQNPSRPWDTGSYATALFASSDEEAAELAKKRNLGEKLSGHLFPSLTEDNPPSKLFAMGKYTAALHYATHLSYIGLKAGTITPEECLGDRGVVHEIIHFIQNWKKAKKDKD